MPDDQRSPDADRSRRYLALRDLPRGRSLPAPESWRSAIGNLILLLVIVGICIAWASVQPVDARQPSDRCDACGIQVKPTPRPTPIVIGIPPRPTPTIVAPTIPPTDT